jgi:hypothetical protein
VDQAVGTGEVDAAQRTHQQAADQSRVHVGDETTDHQPHDQEQTDQRLRRAVGGREDIVELGREVCSLRISD